MDTKAQHCGNLFGVPVFDFKQGSNHTRILPFAQRLAVHLDLWRYFMDVRSITLAAMRKTNDLFCHTAVRLRDMSVLDHVYTPGAHILPPGGEMIHGLAGIKSFWLQTVTGLDVKDACLTTVSAEMAGDTVIEIGRAALTLAGGKSSLPSTLFTGNTTRKPGNGISTSGI
jgi:ketosteroid isomerase-like protein